MQQNFFESLSFADVERIHSQMIAWLFESNTLGQAQKSQILEGVVGKAGEYEVLDVLTERERIDILIETASSFVAIENKIKIGEHDDQLNRYRQALEREKKPSNFVYLSLVPAVICASDWKVRTYAELHAILLPHWFVAPANFSEHAFNEYVDAVGRLTKIVAEFDRDHTKFRNVFTDGSFTKSEKASCALERKYTVQEEFVRMNQLETPLQRYFLEKIGRHILPACTKRWVRESHGVANINIVIATRLVNGTAFQWAVQFQGKTSKLNCYAENYEKSTCNQLPDEIKVVFQELENKSDVLRLNPGRSKAYISVSKPLNLEWSDPFEKIAESYRAAYVEFFELGKAIALAHGVEAASSH